MLLVISSEIRNKFDLLPDQIKGSVNILMILETEINNIFLVSHFEISDFNTPFWVDQNQKRGGMLFIKEKILPKLQSTDNSIESYFVHLNLICTTWPVNYLYKRSRNIISAHLDLITHDLDLYFSKFDN